MRKFTFGHVRSFRGVVGLAVGVSALLVGCQKPGNSDPSFMLNDQGIDPDSYTVLRSDDTAQADAKTYRRVYLASALEAMFGTPDRPFVFRETGLNLDKIRKASGPVGGLKADEQLAERNELRAQESQLKDKLSKELEPAAKAAAEAGTKAQADIKPLQASLAEAKKANNAAQAADLEKQIAPLQEKIDAKNKADGEVAATKGTLDDVTMQIKSYIVPQAGLYRQHCVHCHGVTGDGAGPTALFLFPYPRDYRQGIFKFKSTALASKPTHADLTRILVDGIPDTAMPSFRLLQPDELDSLVEYVKYLSIRGQAEAALREAIAEVDDPKSLKTDRSYLVETALKLPVDNWNEADTTVIEPRGEYAQSLPHDKWLAEGKTLFLGEKGKCSTCHGTTGLGDGRNSKPFYDEWNKLKAKNLEDLAAAVAAKNADEIAKQTNIEHSWLLPLQQQYPRNLRLNRFRFGRRPLDIYRRIATGIAGTEMPGFAAALSDTEIWQIVDYVMSLPYDPLGLPADMPGHGTGGHGDGEKAHGGHATNAPALPAPVGAKPNDQAQAAIETKSAGGE